MLTLSIEGTRIGRVKVIFTLPTILDTRLGPQEAPSIWPKTPLAYIEWYSKIPSTASKANGNMYHIKRIEPLTTIGPARVPGTIIPISNIRQSCMLFPAFPKGEISGDWKSDNILDKCPSFLINNWSSKYAYQTIW